MSDDDDELLVALELDVWTRAIVLDERRRIRRDARVSQPLDALRAGVPMFEVDSRGAQRARLLYGGGPPALTI